MPARPEPDVRDTAFLLRARAAAGVGAPATLSPEVHRDLSRRLANVALSYAGAYGLAYGTMWVRMLAGGHRHHSILPDVVAVLSITLGIVVYLAARGGKLPPVSFSNIALLFQVAGAVGIMGGAWGWESHLDLFQRHVWEAIGSPAVSYPEGLVERLREARLRIVEFGGVPWVGVWLLVLPILVPQRPKRVLLGVLLTAAVVPGVLGLSLVVNGVPASVRPWVGDLLLDSSIPTFICALLSYFGSTAVYRLARDLSRAQEMGSYRLVERIGAGGMGEVWRAQHQLLARPSAIKLIRPDARDRVDSPSARELLRRFEREAQATALLRSPHTVELYDFGIAPDGTFYYVMELLEGFDLDTLVQKFGPVPASRASYLLAQVCHSLEDAHRSGLIHRDVKPSNIFTCRRGLDHDFVKVLDFGLVKHLEEDREAADLTLPGVARGTPAFMAPEAVTGKAPVDARSDLYALGCVAYWLVTGHLVFKGPTPMATLLQHVNDPPVPPSERLDEPIPAPLEQLILECLAKDPAGRPPSAAAVAARLAEHATQMGSWTSRDAEGWWMLHAPKPG